MGAWSDEERQREHNREVAFNLGAQSRDAEIARLKARAEKAEANLAAACEWLGIAERERDQALAACAEMRAALEMLVNGPQSFNIIRAVEMGREALSRTALGAGMVLVPREVVKGTRDSLRVADRLRRLAVKVVCLPRSIVDSVEAPASLLQAIDDMNRDEADFERWEGKLDALLGKAGG